MDPYTLHRPRVVTRNAVLFDSPHSGRFYPPDFLSNATHTELRRGEDAYVDELLAVAPTLGAWLLVANYPRCYIDLNRAESDIDAALLAEPWPEPLYPSDKTKRGLGLIRRYVVPGIEVQARPLTVAEVRHRIDRVYRPYRAALRRLVDEIRAERDVLFHVNWHSMKSRGNAMTPDGPDATRADFVVSDVNGRSAGPALTGRVVAALRGMGYTVSVNDPYTGGTIVQSIGDPGHGVHSLQIEINRRLYLDEQKVERANGFVALASRLAELTQLLANDVELA